VRSGLLLPDLEKLEAAPDTNPHSPRNLNRLPFSDPPLLRCGEATSKFVVGQM